MTSQDERIARLTRKVELLTMQVEDRERWIRLAYKMAAEQCPELDLPNLPEGVHVLPEPGSKSKLKERD